MPDSIERHQQAVQAAKFQCGVISHFQLTKLLGWPASAVRTQIDSHRWQRVHVGVYAVTTGKLPIESLWWAAHLKCGGASALTGSSALQAWQIARPQDPIELQVPNASSGRTPGLEIHRTRNLLATRSPKGLPPAVIPVAALLSASNRLEASAVIELVSTAFQKGRVSPVQLQRELSRMRVRHRKLLTELAREGQGGSTSPLEIAGVRNVLRAHGLPEGDGQVREYTSGRVAIRDRVIHGLIIEFDGQLGHANAAGRFRDLARDNAAVLSGRPTLRFGWTDVHQEPCHAADQVAIALANLQCHVQVSPCSPHCSSTCIDRNEFRADNADGAA